MARRSSRATGATGQVPKPDITEPMSKPTSSILCKPVSTILAATYRSHQTGGGSDQKVEPVRRDPTLFGYPSGNLFRWKATALQSQNCDFRPVPVLQLT